MGAQQSSEQRKLYVKDATGKPVAIPGDKLAEYISESQMTDSLRRLADNGIISAVNVYSSPAMTSSTVYYRGNMRDLSERFAEINADASLHAEIMAILTKFNVADNASTVADDIIAAINTRQFHKSYTFQTGDSLRDGIMKTLDEIPSGASISGDAKIEVARVFEDAIRKILHRVYDGGAESNTGIVFAGGAYERISGSHRVGGDPKGPLGSLFALDLEHISKHKAEIAEKIANDLVDIISKAGYGGTFKFTDEMKTSDKLRNIADVLTKRAPANVDAIIDKFTDAINSVFGVMTLDPGLPLDIRVRQMTELLSALSHGVTIDFYLTGVDIINGIKQITLIKGALDTACQALENRISQTDRDYELTRAVGVIKAMSGELGRVISNMNIELNTSITPSITKLISDISEQPRPGSSLAERVKDMLLGLMNTGSHAIVAADALKRMGMTIDEYKKIANERDFWTRFVELTDPRNLKEGTNIDEITRAADILAKMLPMREDIAKSLSAKAGGAATDPTSYVVKSVEVRSKRANIVMNTYRIALQSGISKIRATINAMIPAIGKELEIGTTMEKFIDLLRQLADIKIESPRIHLALLRYARDTQAVEARDRVIGTLRAVADYAKFAAKQPEVEKGAEYFNAVASAIEELLTAIETGAESVRVIRGGSAVDGGADIVENIGDMTVRDRIRLSESIEEMLYAIRVTQFKRNLESAVVPFTKNVAGYEESVLGPAVAERIDNIRKSFEEAVEFYKGADDLPANGNFKVNDYIKQESQDFIDEYYKGITLFWDAVQAVEMYLKNFTGSLIGNPSEISEIEMMMREVEIISEPYSATRDSAIGKIFEYNFGVVGDKIEHNGNGNDKIIPCDYNISVPYQKQAQIGALPFTCIVNERLKGLLADTTANLKSFIALKNLIAFFAHFGGRIGAAKLKEIGRRTPGEIYNALVTFMATSTFMFGVRYTHHIKRDTGVIGAGDGTKDVVPKPDEAGQNEFTIGLELNTRGVLMRPATISANAFDPTTAPAAPGAAKFKLSKVLSLDIENKVFTALIKALAGKILVLSGMHDLISRPHTQYERIAIRTTIGGAINIPKIIPEAVELYVRLPLFALFYRKNLKYDDSANQSERQIAILPDIAGSIFGEFINLMFNRFTRDELSLLTENEVCDLIAEINTIYTKMAPKYPKETVMSIIREFVRVISRMIYIVKKDDYKDVNKILYADKASIDVGMYTSDEKYDIDILGDEDQFGVIKRPMPAETAIGYSDTQRRKPSGINLDESEIINKFRCKIEKQLSEGSSFSLRGSITATRVKVDQTTNDTDKFRMICGLIRGTGSSTSIENLRSLIFAEILGTGLGILSGIHSILKRLQIAVYCSNAENIVTILKSSPADVIDKNAYIKHLKEGIKKLLRCDEKLIESIITYNIAGKGNNVVIMIDSNEIKDDVFMYSENMKQIVIGATAVPETHLKSAVFCYPHAMRTLLEYLARASSETNGFIRVDISDRKLHVNVAGIEEYIRQTINTLTKFVDIMRPHIDPKIVENYTGKETVGSLYWLQERLVERMIIGRVTAAGEVGNYITLSETARHATEAFNILTSKVIVDTKEFHVNYVREFAKMIAHGENPLGGFRNADIISDPFDALLVRGTTRDKTVDTRFLRSFDITSEKNVYSNVEEGCLFAFNRLLAMFLRQVYDTSTGKIFNGLINNFAQGAFNSAIMKERNTYPDHLPMYWVNTGKTRDLYEPGTVGPDECSLIKYLNWLKDLPENFSNPFQLKSPQLNTKIGEIHPVIAGLLIAWFATESDIIIDKTKEIDSQDEIGKNIMDKTVSSSINAIFPAQAPTINIDVGRLISALRVVRDNYNELFNPTTLVQQGQPIIYPDDAASYQKTAIKRFIRIYDNQNVSNADKMRRAIMVVISAALQQGDIDTLEMLCNRAYNAHIFFNNTTVLTTIGIPGVKEVNEALAIPYTSVQANVNRTDVAVTAENFQKLWKILVSIVLQSNDMNANALHLALILRSGTIPITAISVNDPKADANIAGGDLNTLINCIENMSQMPDKSIMFDMISNGITLDKSALYPISIVQNQPNWLNVIKEIYKNGYYDVFVRDRINKIPDIAKLSARYKWLNLLTDANSDSNVIIRNRMIKSIGKEWQPDMIQHKNMLELFARVDHSPINIAGYDMTNDIKKFIPTQEETKKLHSLANAAGNRDAVDVANITAEDKINAYITAYFNLLNTARASYMTNTDPRTVTEITDTLASLYDRKWGSVARIYNIDDDIVKHLFSRITGTIGIRKQYTSTLIQLIIANKRFDENITNLNRDEQTAFTLETDLLAQYIDGIRLLPYLAMIRNLSFVKQAGYEPLCTSLQPIITSKSNLDKLRSDVVVKLFDDRKYEFGKTFIEKMIPNEKSLDKLIKLRCLLRDDTVSDYRNRYDSMEFPKIPYEFVATNPKTSVRGKEIARHIISLADYSDAEISDDVIGGGTFITYPGKTTDTSTRESIIKYHGSLHDDAQTDAERSDFMDNDAFGNRKIPDGDHVLFATLGHILFNILTVTDERTGIRAHLLESAADIPAHMRNKYRAILPFFRAAFHSLSQTCDLYIRVMEQTSSECFSGNISNADAKSYGKVGYKFNGIDSQRLIGILRAITTGASAIVQDCTQTLTSIGDQPHYFETHGDSITAFRTQNNGVDPIMPVSPLLRVLMTKNGIIADDLQPKYSFGEPAFKYQFAIRGLYHNIDTKSKPDPLNVLTAVDSMISSFNKFSYGGIKIDAPVAADIAKLLMNGFDFIHDVSRVKFYVVKPPKKEIADMFTNTEQSDKDTTDALRTSKTNQFVPVQFGINDTSAPNVSNIIAVVENHNREDSIKVVVRTTSEQDRDITDSIIANIIDTNIIPIDIHVLSRQIPLHFIWNYAFTFDVIAGSIVYENIKQSTLMNSYFKDCVTDTRNIKSARDAMFKMIIDPYCNLSQHDKMWVDRMLIGAHGVPGIGRIKFISDQLAGGILFGGLNRDSDLRSEIGPQTIYTTPGRKYITGYPLTDAIVGVTVDENEMYLKILMELTRLHPDITGGDLISIRNIFGTIRPATGAPKDMADNDTKDLTTTSNADVKKKLEGVTDQTIAFRKVIQEIIANPAVTYGNTVKYLISLDKIARVEKLNANKQAKGNDGADFDYKDLKGLVDSMVAGGVRNDQHVQQIKFISQHYADAMPISPIINTATDDATAQAAQARLKVLIANPISDGSDLRFDTISDEYGAVTFEARALDANLRKYAPLIHDMRMDTLLVRNLIHISLVFAIMQSKLRDDVLQSRGGRIASSMGALNPSTTQFFGFQSSAQKQLRDVRDREVKKYI